MLSLDYGSDSEGEEASTQPTTTSAVPIPSSSKTSLNLPTPKAGSSSSDLSLPPPKTKKTKKIAIALPELSKEKPDNDLDEEPPAKKPRITRGSGGAGVSSLLSMLPAPKQPADAPPPRVLGGGKGKALAFNTNPSTQSADDSLDDVSVPDASLAAITSSLPFRPASLAKNRTNVNVEESPSIRKATAPKPPEPAVDFFSLGSASSSRPSTSSPAINSAPSITSISMSSAPKVEEFTPPEPTPQDEYPGYYKLPSGDWAAYDPAYYKKFYDKWKKEYDAHVRALEKGTKGFEAYDEDQAAEVNTAAEMERAKVEIKEREERKALTTGDTGGEPAKPRMNIQGAKLGGRARSRHQLTTLLTEAYSNREALEERIAQGKRNRKEAGMKYGF